MTNKRKTFDLGVRLKPTDSAPSLEGELAVTSTSPKVKAYVGGANREVLTADQVQTVTNKSLDIDNNTLTNVEVDNLKSGVLNTSTILSGATDTQVPSALAVKTYVDNTGGATATNVANLITLSGVAANSTDLGTFTGTTIPDNSDNKEALQSLETGLEAHLNDTSGAHAGSAISFSPTGTIGSTDVQAMGAELDGDIQGHITNSTGAHAASAISNTPSGNLAATTVQGALNELQTDVDTRATSASLTAHTGASSGVHGVTGSVVGTTDTQTLSAKTFSDAVTIAEISTPSTPASGFGKIYFKSDGNAYQLNDSGVESVLYNPSSGSSSGKNYILNPDAESSTTGWATYADAAGAAPVDGTGGSPNVTFTRNTTTPLAGTGDFLLTKDAANRQGQGVSYDFTIDNEDFNFPLYVSFSYKTSAGYASGDVRCYLYDVTNSTLLAPAILTLTASTTAAKHKISFPKANSGSYRLIFHVASTSATAWTLNFDTVTVAPNMDVVALYSTNAGQSITDSTATIVDFEDVALDTHSAVTTGASWAFVAPISGRYIISGHATYSNAASFTGGVTCQAQIFIDGVEYENNVYSVDATVTNLRGHAAFSVADLNKGQSVNFKTRQSNGNTRSLTTTTSQNRIYIYRLGDLRNV